MKYIELKLLEEAQLVIDLQNLVLETTNARFISTELHRLCTRFVKELKQIPLSEELQ